MVRVRVVLPIYQVKLIFSGSTFSHVRICYFPLLVRQETHLKTSPWEIVMYIFHYFVIFNRLDDKSMNQKNN